MTYIFDGKKFAVEEERKLWDRVSRLKKKGINPKLVSIIVGDDPASHLYVNLKKKAGERVGIEVDIVVEKSNADKFHLVDLIKSLNLIKNVHGIMVQLPLPSGFSEADKDEIINSISSEKDVDGLKKSSRFLHPTSKAVLEILNFALIETKLIRPKIILVGATGMVGRPLVKELKRNFTDVVEADSSTRNLALLTKQADVIISATGVQNLITGDMVKDGAILIDVGSPRGDIVKEAYTKASFVSPVPGGVGPVTITCLLENLIQGELKTK